MAEPISVVRPQGRLDSSTSRDFEQDLLKRIDGGEFLLVLDFSNLVFISSAGLRAILLAAKQLKVAGGRLAICSPNKHVKEILDVTGCTTLLGVFPTYDAAAAHLAMT
jgi:stage II sporulation protein AA (anti-sigma F factor antagonist)